MKSHVHRLKSCGRVCRNFWAYFQGNWISGRRSPLRCPLGVLSSNFGGIIAIEIGECSVHVLNDFWIIYSLGRANHVSTEVFSQSLTFIIIFNFIHHVFHGILCSHWSVPAAQTFLKPAVFHMAILPLLVVVVVVVSASAENMYTPVISNQPGYKVQTWPWYMYT